ncbi:hypothetical protein [Paracidovorax avenae]|uniref:hypothetical protein n=1 Tax=Paracidovorax avenae TaxID=80867 RepID=UPI001E45EB28|nr:hypothetical protein [Paracidovorax avenae]
MKISGRIPGITRYKVFLEWGDSKVLAVKLNYPGKGQEMPLFDELQSSHTSVKA